MWARPAASVRTPHAPTRSCTPDLDILVRAGHAVHPQGGTAPSPAPTAMRCPPRATVRDGARGSPSPCRWPRTRTTRRFRRQAGCRRPRRTGSGRASWWSMTTRRGAACSWIPLTSSLQSDCNTAALTAIVRSDCTPHTRPSGELSGPVPPGNARHAVSRRKRIGQADSATFAIGSLREDAVVLVTAVSSLGFTLPVAMISHLRTRRGRMTTWDAYVLAGRSLTS